MATPCANICFVTVGHGSNRAQVSLAAVPFPLTGLSSLFRLGDTMPLDDVSSDLESDAEMVGPSDHSRAAGHLDSGAEPEGEGEISSGLV